MIFNNTKFYIQKIINLLKHKAGTVIAEFAFILPILLLILTSTIEISNLVYASQKHQTSALIASSLVANLDTLKGKFTPGIGNSKPISDIALIQQEIIGNLGQTNSVNMVVTIIQNGTLTSGTKIPFVFYQEKHGNSIQSKFNYQSSPPGSSVDDSYIQKNKVTNLNNINNYPFEAGEQIIIVETRVNYNPLFASFLGSTEFTYETPIIIPRIGKFKFLPDGTANI